MSDVGNSILNIEITRGVCRQYRSDAEFTRRTRNIFEIELKDTPEGRPSFLSIKLRINTRSCSTNRVL